MAGSICGRDAELAVVRGFVASLPEGAAGLILEGAAGMGKTTIWAAGVADAAERGVRVLEARPAVTETALSFSGVGDLLDPCLAEALEPLPAPQRRALSRALLLDDDGPAPDPHAIGVAVLNALRVLALSGPVLVAVDDVQWLDPASMGALGYAGRRLRSERVGVMLARRTPSEVGLVAELRRSLPAERCAILAVTPFDIGALHRVVQEHLGTALSRPLLAEIHEASGGNPFYALEIVRTLERTGVSVEPGQRLPVPESLRDLVHGRVEALPVESRDFLLAAAAHAQPTVAVSEAASGVMRRDGLAPALAAGVVELDGERIRFTHPLLAAGSYETADPDRRRSVHTRLAELLEDSEARAWQLAASVSEPDERVAVALEGASRDARSRGALRPAALLLDRATELTPHDLSSETTRRAVDAAYLHFESGDSRRAESQLRAVIAPLPPGHERVRGLVVLARIRLYDAPGEAFELFTQVLREAADDRATLALAHEGAAACSLWMFERFHEALRHTDVALALADELGDDAFAADVLMNRVAIETILGRETAAATVERALAAQESAIDRRVLDQPLAGLAERWLWVDEHGRARDALDLLMRRADELGDENARPWLLLLLGRLERALGNLEPALGRAREAQEAAEQSGQPLFSAIGLALESLVEAELGRVERARELARRSLEVGSSKFEGLVASEALGHVELALGSPDRAVAELAPWVVFARDEGVVEPGVIRFVVDHMEALIELGRRDEAAELLDWFEGNAARLERVSVLASCRRCRGLLAAQAGDLDEAQASFRDALELHAQVDILLDRGRTLLALGAAQRRAKRRREARQTLQTAVALFERVGAALWAERARGELERISGRAPTPGALTPAEERVAALVAEGRTNQEVADVLFLSKRTVDGHVSRILGKLGIRHRTELARALASRQTQASAPSNTGTKSVSAESLAP